MTPPGGRVAAGVAALSPIKLNAGEAASEDGVMRQHVRNTFLQETYFLFLSRLFVSIVVNQIPLFTLGEVNSLLQIDEYI